MFSLADRLQAIPARIEAMSTRRWTLLLIATALLIRLTWCLAMAPRQPQFDEHFYIAQAVNVAEGKGYIDEKGRPAAYWPVGYPTVLASTYAVFGQTPLPGILLQVIFGIGACVLISIVGSAAFEPIVGRLAALLLALYPNHISYSTLFLTEPLFTLLLMISIALLLKGAKQETTATAAAGFVIGLATLVRPMILLFPLALPLWYWRTGLRPAAIIKRTLLAFCFTLVAISPWLIRNHRFMHRWILTTEGGQDFWRGNYPNSFGGYAYRTEINEAMRVGSDYDFSQGYRLGLNAIAASPLRALLRVIPKISFFFALETDGILWNLKGLPRPPSKLATAAILGAASAAYLLVLTFAILGIIGTRRDDPLASLFLLLTGYLVLITAVFIGDPRYHYGLIPLAVIFAAKGFFRDWPSLRIALKAKNSSAQPQLLAWGATVFVFFLLIVANLGWKILEIRALGR
jgi:4-amino-4-deoxy-L-arabinose transferase-like glycosyltransferase